jgi:hypothetical protein
MGIALLPWEHLPAYVLGPLFVALNAWLLYMDDHLSPWNWALGLGGIAFGLWLVWARYKTGEEPLWSEEKRAAARRQRGEP